MPSKLSGASSATPSPIDNDPIRVAVGIIWRAGQVVVGRRAGDVLAGFDEFPGGKCQPGESPTVTVVRESLEETGLSIQVCRLRDRARHVYPHGIVEIDFYDAVPSGNLFLLRAPFEWWSVDQILAGNFPSANAGVIESIKKRPGPAED